jgi:nucleotide sugar dehydrogenase
MKIGIVGHGFVGQAVEYGFNSPANEFKIFDLNRSGSTINDVVDTDAVFICLPTETKDNMHDAYSILEVCNQLAYSFNYKGLVIIKSSLMPGALDLPQWKEARARLRLVMNPELLTQARANRDFVEAPMLIIGADDQQHIDDVKVLYSKHSNVTKKWFMEMSVNEAILMKLFINVFLASKVALMNEFREMLAVYSDRPWNEFAHMMAHDTRICRAHTQSPGPDGKVGYGGKCFPSSMGTFARTAIQKNTTSSTVAGAAVSNSLIRK